MDKGLPSKALSTDAKPASAAVAIAITKAHLGNSFTSLPSYSTLR